MDENVISLADVIAIIKRRKWYLIWPAVSILIVSITIALFWPPTYQSTSTILIEEQSIPRDYVRTTVSDYAEMRLQIINQRIMSSMRLSEIINRFNLYSDLRKKATLEAAIDRMREKDIKFETNSANVIDGRTGQSKMATISFSLSYKGSNPGAVQQVANVLASLYLEENLRVREQQTEGATKFMDDERKIIEAQLAETDNKIAIFKKDNVNTLPELSQYNLQIIDRLAEETNRLNVKIKELKEKENYIESQLVNISPNISNPDKDHLKELRVKLMNLESRFTDEYPDVRKTRAEIADLEKKVKTSRRMPTGSDPDNPAYVTLSAQLASIRSEITSVNGQIRDTRARYNDYQRRVVTTPQVEENYKVLMMQRSNLQAKYEDLTKKYMESKVASGLERGQMGERFTLIEAAKLPLKPVSPNVPAIIMIGLILGIGAGMAAAALKEFSDQSVYTAEKLASVLELPVLAVIPEISIVKEKPRKKNRQFKYLTNIGIVAAMICVIVLLFHFFVMDLDILWARIIRTVGGLIPY